MVHHWERRGIGFLHDRESAVEKHRLREGRKTRTHDLGDGRIRPSLAKRHDEIVASKHAADSTILVDNWKIVLGGMQHRLDCGVQCGVPRKSFEPGHHCVAHPKAI
jgi:hypothetical protein